MSDDAIASTDALDARADGPSASDAGFVDATGEMAQLPIALMTFMSFGGNPTGVTPGGSCWFAAGLVGETVTLETCAPQTPLMSLGLAGQKHPGELRIGALCVQAPAGGAAGNAILDPCDGSPAQSWGFEAGRIESNPAVLGTASCLMDSGGDNPDNLVVGQGNCGVDPSGRNLWMPVGFPIDFRTADAAHTWCVEDLEQAHDCNQAGTALTACAAGGYPPFWQYNVWYQGTQRTYAWLDLADGYALDVYGSHLGADGAGVVDMATPTGAPGQIWGFATAAATPAMSVLLESDVNEGGACLGAHGGSLDAGVPLDVTPCGPGSSVAQLWYPRIFGFPP